MMGMKIDTSNNTIARVRVECSDATTLENVLRSFSGALGKPERVSKPYPNRDENGMRIYAEWVVPCAPASEGA